MYGNLWLRRSFLCAAFIAPLAFAAFPEKPIRIIAAFSPGSATDNIARLVGEELTAAMGASVIIENKPGAQGVIGTDYAIRQPADGYTLTISSTSLNSINPGLIKNLPYDAIKDFSHIIRLTTMPVLLLVKADSPYKNVQDLVAAAEGGKLNFGYGSPGGQVGAEAFNSMAKIKSVGAGYKSQPQALADLAGGVVDYVVADTSVAGALMRANRIRAIAVSAPQRLSDWKDVPTFVEAGFKDYDLVTWVGLAAPANLSKDIVEKINTTIAKALTKPRSKERLATLGMEPGPNTVQEQDQFVRAQLDAWQRRMKEAGITPQ
ncbi:tripartite tricarboxylate transporter substrate binding protein [Comamonas thiooxydans]|uniref:Bug family tripartite tricarboxylate transporter substrate binding protein n=1 Tax=Comamonas thiooxydans TaxID=363952 RepID=UPI00244CE1A7|nr:tripartite tricarboxylate transporter substrate binding protein [Comamonas thiooxydans]MDH1473379.1 tripartite tricarboxylate transporter substrate binding protein [Comamonas thiooxydans]